MWQPHTYSRTQALRDDFLAAFKDADHVLITEIYAAREQPIDGVNAADLAAQMDHPDARFTPTFEEAVETLDGGGESACRRDRDERGGCDADQRGVFEAEGKSLTQRRKG